MIYTELESHSASMRERWALLSLIWRSTGDPDVSVKARRAARRMAIRHYVFSLRPQASTYLVNRSDDA